MVAPGIRIDEYLNDRHHREQRKSRESRAEPQREKYRQAQFRRRGNSGGRDRIEQGDLVFVSKEQDGKFPGSDFDQTRAEEHGCDADSHRELQSRKRKPPEQLDGGCELLRYAIHDAGTVETISPASASRRSARPASNSGSTSRPVLAASPILRPA